MQIIVLTTFASCCSNFLNDRKIALMMIHTRDDAPSVNFQNDKVCIL